MACFAASSGASPFCEMFTSTLSTTTMASSTTRPMARIMPNMVSMLIEKPSRCMPTKVPMMETGTARIGITVARSDCRKMNTTSTTSITASKKVCTTFSIEYSVNWLVSRTIL